MHSLATSTNRYIYVNTYSVFENDAPNGGLDDVFQVDLKKLELGSVFVKKLNQSRLIRNTGPFENQVKNTFVVLANARLLKITPYTVYLINLQEDSSSPLAYARFNEWFVSGIVQDMYLESTYDFKVENNHVKLGLYSRNQTLDGQPITIDKYGTISTTQEDVEGKYNDMIQPKFLRYIKVKF